MGCNKCFFSTASDRVRLIRAILKIKRDTFCKYMDIAPSTLWLWENKTLRLSEKQKYKLRYVGINPQWVDYGTGEPFTLNQKTVANNILNYKPST